MLERIMRLLMDPDWQAVYIIIGYKQGRMQIQKINIDQIVYTFDITVTVQAAEYLFKLLIPMLIERTGRSPIFGLNGGISNGLTNDPPL